MRVHRSKTMGLILGSEIENFLYASFPSFLEVLLSTQRVMTASSTQNHNDLRCLPLPLMLLSFICTTSELITSGINEHLSEHREIRFDICSFS